MLTVCLSAFTGCRRLCAEAGWQGRRQGRGDAQPPVVSEYDVLLFESVMTVLALVVLLTVCVLVLQDALGSR